MPDPLFVQYHHETLIKNSSIPCAQILDRKSPRRCHNLVNKRNIANVKQLLEKVDDALTGSRTYQTAILQQHLDGIAQLCICWCHKKNADFAVRQWLQELHVTGSSERSDTERVPDPEETGASLTMRITRSMAAQPRGDGLRSLSPQDRHGLKFTRHNPKVKTIADVDRDLITRLSLQLGPRDRITGSLYVLWIPYRPGFYKIGYSTRPQSRLSQHTLCYPDGELLMSFPEIPHVYRVEQLVFRELALHHRKLEDPCIGCTAKHKEWFEVDREVIVRVVSRWLDFILTCPYTAEGTLKTHYKMPIVGFPSVRKEDIDERWQGWINTQQAADLGSSLPAVTGENSTRITTSSHGEPGSCAHAEIEPDSAASNVSTVEENTDNSSHTEADSCPATTSNYWTDVIIPELIAALGADLQIILERVQVHGTGFAATERRLDNNTLPICC